MDPKLPLVAGNWKMFTDRSGARRLAEGVVSLLGGLERPQIAIFPPFPFLADAGDVIRGSGCVLGAQDLWTEPRGAFTGEVSGPMLASLGCRQVLVGHSERRHVLGETDDLVARKVRAALDAGLAPILCVGETLEEREGGATESVLRRQLESALEPLAGAEFERCIIAYEPVWAIGTGRTAAPEQAREVHRFARGVLGKRFGEAAAARCRILYGGSVKPDNIEGIMAQDGIDGVLVGGASLEAESFAAIARGTPAL